MYKAQNLPCQHAAVARKMPRASRPQKAVSRDTRMNSGFACNLHNLHHATNHELRRMVTVFS